MSFLLTDDEFCLGIVRVKSTEAALACSLCILVLDEDGE